MDVRLEVGWKSVLALEFEKEYFEQLSQTVRQEITSGITVYPPGKLIFNAFDLTPFDKTKVVILGQDPYHGPGQAHGLCFSVPKGIPPPPSVQNIFKELNTDLGIPIPDHANLESWALQGVFLLNAVLTVRAGAPTSHSQIGWQTFTDAVIQTLSQHRSGLIFLLWGNFARTKRNLIDTSKHFVLEAAHPSPLSRGAFFGNRHFSQTNALLQRQGLAPIDWRV
ncbi:MAG: uracil-DNA glycosylase [Prevotellaceae bacterium]|nr:uracil-DNA glycosylase [Prevotellaceae bacterium]